MAQNQSTFDRIYPVEPGALYAAVVQAVADGPYRKAGSDEFTRSVSFKSKGSFASWGHQWQGQVVADANGSRLHLTGAAFHHAGAGSTDKLALKVSQRFFDDVSRRCAAAQSA